MVWDLMSCSWKDAFMCAERYVCELSRSGIEEGQGASKEGWQENNA